ncbi:MAG: hypothetical protein U0271_11065 [Polyangiaceae bacterium]
MANGKVTVLTIDHATLLTTSQAEDAPANLPDGLDEAWAFRRGKNGASFFTRALAGGSLVVPFMTPASLDDLALHLRELLGDALDLHSDERGVFVRAEFNGEAYDAVTKGEGTFVARVGADDPRLSKAEGWSFAAAAKTLEAANPAAAERGELRAKLREERGDADLQAREEELLAVVEEREDRGALRMRVSAALKGNAEDTALGDVLREGEEEDDENDHNEARGAESLRRGFKMSPRAVAAMEGALHEVIPDQVATAEENETPAVSKTDPPPPPESGPAE